MKTLKKTSQPRRVEAYLRKNRRGITTMEAFRELGITCVHKRIAELEGMAKEIKEYPFLVQAHPITRTPERTATGSTVTRYKLAR